MNPPRRVWVHVTVGHDGTVMIRPATPRTAARLAALPLTAPHPADGADVPAGFRAIHASVLLQRRDVDEAADELMYWGLHRRSGLDPRPTTARAELGTDVLLGVGAGPLRIHAPCRVLEVIETDDRVGFAYGTLRGHPECGIERFELVRDDSGALTLQLSGFSRPGSRTARRARPVADAVQRRIMSRYLRVLDRP
jgi:uncharacterized protein (UPF0548 family)